MVDNSPPRLIRRNSGIAKRIGDIYPTGVSQRPVLEETLTAWTLDVVNQEQSICGRDIPGRCCNSGPGIRPNIKNAIALRMAVEAGPAVYAENFGVGGVTETVTPEQKGNCVFLRRAYRDIGD